MRFIIVLLLLGAALAASPRIAAPFTGLLSPRITAEGDTLTLAAVFSANDKIFLYANADGSILIYDTLGSFIQKVICEDIGRGPFLGDDFIVKGSTAIFLNTIDRYLEYFSLPSGKHLRSIPYPDDHFSTELRPADRFIDRIFLESGRMVLGNGKKQFYFDPSLGKSAACQTALFAGEKRRILAWNGRYVAEETPAGTGIETPSMIYSKVPRSASFRGGQYYFQGGRLMALTVSDTGFCVGEVQP